MKLAKAMSMLYKHKGYRTEVIDEQWENFMVGLFSNEHEARVCIALITDNPKLFSTVEKMCNFNRHELEICMVKMFRRLAQDHVDPWLWDVHFDCLTVYEYKEGNVMCRLHMDIDEDMEV